MRRSALLYHDQSVSDMPDFSVDSPTPVYVRVADWIESRIKSGELKSGARLPAERDLGSRVASQFHGSVDRFGRFAVVAGVPLQGD